MARYPATYGEGLGIRSADTPSGLFRMLVMALLMGARIRADIAGGSSRLLETALEHPPKR